MAEPRTSTMRLRRITITCEHPSTPGVAFTLSGSRVRNRSPVTAP